MVAVAPGSPAAAGLRTGDLVTAFGGRPVRSVGDLLAALREADPGDRVELTVLRAGDERTVAVTVGRRGPA